MKNSLQFTKIIICLLLLVFIAGCKSKKVAVVGTGGELKSKSHNEVLDDVLTHELDYKTITTKGKVSLNGKEFTTIFKLVKDEVIQASIRPLLGIEAMRLDITPQKATLLDRLNGRYAEIKLEGSDIDALVAFNFYNLQALLTNQLFVAGSKRVSKENYDKFTVLATGDKFILQTEDKNNLQYNFSVDASERITSTEVSYPEKEMNVVWNYDQFVEDGVYIYPTNMVADVKVKKRNLKIGVSYSDLDVNTDFNIDQSVPSRYKKVEIAELIGEYMKLK